MQSEAISLDTVEEGALLHHHLFERWEHIVVAFLHVLVLGLHRRLLHKLLHIGNLSSKVFGALLQTFLQQGVGLIVGRSDDNLTVLQLEAFGYIHKLGLYSARASLVFGNELRKGTAEMTIEQVEHTKGGYANVLDELWIVCKQYNADMVLMYDQISCKGMDGLRGVFEEQAAARGVHMLWVAQDLLDSRTISKRDMRRQVNLYMQTVMGEEPVRPDLVDFDDALTW